MTFMGWIEVAVIMLLAFVIIGPKDLPRVLYAVGSFTAKMRKYYNDLMAELDHIHHFSEVEKMVKLRKKKDE